MKLRLRWPGISRTRKPEVARAHIRAYRTVVDKWGEKETYSVGYEDRLPRVAHPRFRRDYTYLYVYVYGITGGGYV